MNRQELWALYSDVRKWPEWDVDIDRVTLEGDFATGGRGVMMMKNGQALPFVIESAEVEKGFVTSSQLGEIRVVFRHVMTDESICHGVEISGGAEASMESLGRRISANLPEVLERLKAMVAQ